MKYIVLVLLIIEWVSGLKVDELEINKSVREIRVERQLVKVSTQLEIVNKGQKTSEYFHWCVAPSLVNNLSHLAFKDNQHLKFIK